MEPDKQQGATPPEAPVPPEVAGKKVIQPSESFIAEMKAAPAAPVSAPVQPQPAPVTTTLPEVPAASPPPAVASSAIYPEPTRGIGVTSGAAPDTPGEAPQAKGGMSSAKVMAVRIVAGVLILINVLAVFNWFLQERSGYTNWITLIELVVELILVIGIFRLSEFARSVYVFLSVLVLILTVISLIVLYTSTQHISNANTPLTKVQLEKALAEAQKNPTLTPAQKQQAEKQTQAEIASLPGSASKFKQYLSQALLFIVAIFPLVFFTRPAIKEVFE